MIILLENDKVKVSLLEKGATIYKIEVKDSLGNFSNIVLSHKNIDEYKNGNDGYLGATCGRVAGRIKNAQFIIDDTTYNLDKNYKGIHNHHGGFKSLSHIDWNYEIIEDESKKICVFSCKSNHLDGGFPANVDIKVSYILENNKLTIQYYATADRKTYLNLTNHSYFNLSKNNTILGHKMQIDCEKYVSIDEDVFSKEILDVDANFNFKELATLVKLKDIVNDTTQEVLGFDNAFLLNKKNKDFDLFLVEESSGINMKIKTSYPALILYSYNYPVNDSLLNRENNKYQGLAIEPQFMPNAMNDDRFFIPITDEINPYNQYIEYTFN